MRQIRVVIGVVTIALLMLRVAAWGADTTPTGMKVQDNTLVPAPLYCGLARCVYHF